MNYISSCMQGTCTLCSNIEVALVNDNSQSSDSELQWNLSKAETYETEVFVHFKEVSALERFELKSSHI